MFGWRKKVLAITIPTDDAFINEIDVSEVVSTGGRSGAEDGFEFVDVTTVAPVAVQGLSLMIPSEGSEEKQPVMEAPVSMVICPSSPGDKVTSTLSSCVSPVAADKPVTPRVSPRQAQGLFSEASYSNPVWVPVEELESDEDIGCFDGLFANCSRSRSPRR